jgi:hypothetical protein
LNINETDPAGRLRTRIQRLTRVLEGADADRELAIFRAYQAGVSADEIAHLALMKVSDVHGVIDVYRRDPGSDELSEGADWIQVYPHRGWRVSM